jgi:hypothetical protein
MSHGDRPIVAKRVSAVGRGRLRLVALPVLPRHADEAAAEIGRVAFEDVAQPAGPLDLLDAASVKVAALLIIDLRSGR